MGRQMITSFPTLPLQITIDTSKKAMALKRKEFSEKPLEKSGNKKKRILLSCIKSSDPCNNISDNTVYHIFFITVFQREHNCSLCGCHSLTGIGPVTKWVSIY